ncbi:unnamed protein product [Heterosigma akashiwo]
MNADQLQQVESLCEVLYNSADQNARNHAQQQLLSLQSSAEYIPQCQYILDHSGSAYALLLASTSLTKLITTHWNNFSVPQRVDIRNYILSYLASKGNVLSDFVITALVQLVCRITKLGWFDDVQHRELVEEVKKFLQATVDHCIIGLRVLVALVEELNLPTSGRTLPQHRKTAVSFRDVSLLSVFQIALTTLRQLQAGIPGASEDQERKMRQHALGLSASCLGFDFIGTNPDDKSHDPSKAGVPSSWRNVVQDAETMGLLFDFYKTSRRRRQAGHAEPHPAGRRAGSACSPTDKDAGLPPADDVGDPGGAARPHRPAAPGQLPRVLPPARPAEGELPAVGAGAHGGVRGVARAGQRLLRPELPAVAVVYLTAAPTCWRLWGRAGGGGAPRGARRPAGAAKTSQGCRPMQAACAPTSRR